MKLRHEFLSEFRRMNRSLEVIAVELKKINDYEADAFEPYVEITPK